MTLSPKKRSPLAWYQGTIKIVAGGVDHYGQTISHSDPSHNYNLIDTEREISSLVIMTIGEMGGGVHKVELGLLYCLTASSTRGR